MRQSHWGWRTQTCVRCFPGGKAACVATGDRSTEVALASQELGGWLGSRVCQGLFPCGGKRSLGRAGPRLAFCGSPRLTFWRSPRALKGGSTSVAESSDVTYNFSSGPAALPAEVVDLIQQELPDWHGTGMPVMTLSHRGADIVNLMGQAEHKLRHALSVPDTHEVLFLQGGGVGQFAAVPLNLTEPGDEVAALITGNWGNTAAKEAEQMGVTVHRAADEAATNYTTLPAPDSFSVPARAKYLYYVPNETIQGVEFDYLPHAGVPLVADASSQILSRPMDVAAHGLVFAGTQKNLGIAGAVVVIVDKALLGHARQTCPSVLDYTKMAASDSLLNTPTTFAIYVLDLVLDWVEERGGVRAMETGAAKKAGMVYSLIDASDFYSNPVQPHARSTKNIPFTLADPGLDSTFLAESRAEGLAFLEGHRTVGGMRASIYNAMPEEGVRALTGFMAEFERRFG